jgi:hypothetical protein
MVTLFALQTAGENWSHYLLYIQQVQNGHIICLTNSRWKTVTLFALQTAGENWSQYLLYIQQVKICHIICFTNSR